MREYMSGRWDALQNFIWDAELRRLPMPYRLLIGALRLGQVLLRELIGGELSLRGMSMVYTTLLSVVPLLAFSFSVLKGLGIHNRFEPILYQFLAPLGPQGAELSAQVVAFVARIDVGVLGGLGLIMLIYTQLSLLQKIETSLNHVWQIERLRHVGQRFTTYLSVLLVGPILVFSALGIIASMQNYSAVLWLMEHEPFGTLIVESSRIVPYLLIVAAFTFIYTFIPNTRVRLYAAVVGGLVAGFLWQSTGWAFAKFIAASAGYQAIYSGFAILVLLLIWLYINWLVLLIGAQISFLVQNPQYLTRTRIRLILSNRLKERVALSVMYLVAERHHRNEPEWSAPTLAEHLGLPEFSLSGVITILCARGYLVETQAEPPGLLPAADIATIHIAALIDVVREADDDAYLTPALMTGPAPIAALLTRLQSARDAELANVTLRDLLPDGHKD